MRIPRMPYGSMRLMCCADGPIDRGLDTLGAVDVQSICYANAMDAPFACYLYATEAAAWHMLRICWGRDSQQISWGHAVYMLRL